ncbi:hypothetical protein BMS_2326 [Halobacteriovorax marinus SJ]|uniref:Uncharacterized protein n=1 Tax=Halobacteriovorax marinus (strain ATCC BAA-682 / DSM 15412 / SJ) TaxID=862908 RepID=E1X4F3_HALMS|nr:hypothetical protein [Halobacteriovorax marinus]CBW27125.1 hypothetical protein BMS_2326 [Halobacteriovorax marinus SJ]
MSQELDKFKEQVLKNLHNHGYPEKSISFPLEKMYEVADNKGLSFNKVLEVLKSEGHESELTVDKVIFFKAQETEAELDDNFMAKAQEAMANMSPEQLESIQQMILGMSQEEREDLLKKGKEMGMI